MCMNDEASLKDLASTKAVTPPALRAASCNDSSDGSDSEDRNSRVDPACGIARRRQVPAKLSAALSKALLISSFSTEKYPKVAESCAQPLSQLACFAISSTTGVLNATFWIVFSVYFPFWLAPHAASKTYHRASFQYDASKSQFDNTFWTYGTDYALAIVMTALATSILRYTTVRPSNSSIQRLCFRSASLLALYGISVTAGGIAHHYFTTLESRNTWTFRALWTVCVGTVCSASCSMGMIGTEAFRAFQAKLRSSSPSEESSSLMLMKLPLFSDVFWLAFGGTVTAFCVAGGLSFQRPACDIFVAGITQSPSTFYCMIFFFLVSHHRVANWAKMTGFFGFILNAPLLPMYPLLVQYTDWSLASVNTLLHSWLCVAWCMQGISLLHIIKALVEDAHEVEAKKRTAELLNATPRQYYTKIQ